MKALLDRVFLAVDVSLYHFKYIVPALLAPRVSAEKSADNSGGLPLYVICCLLFSNVFLSLIFVCIINMCWGVIQKQRHYFANKGPSSEGYGFSCGHVWM